MKTIVISPNVTCYDIQRVFGNNSALLDVQPRCYSTLMSCYVIFDSVWVLVLRPNVLVLVLLSLEFKPGSN